MVWSCLSILKLIITMKLPVMVTKLKSPEATPIRLACRVVYGVISLVPEAALASVVTSGPTTTV